MTMGAFSLTLAAPASFTVASRAERSCHSQKMAAVCASSRVHTTTGTALLAVLRFEPEVKYFSAIGVLHRLAMLGSSCRSVNSPTVMILSRLRTPSFALENLTR
jgi:hypothetical protein